MSATSLSHALPAEQATLAGKAEDEMPRETDNRPEAGDARLVRNVLLRHRWRLALTYGLFNVENLLRLAQPYVMGLAITGLLEASAAGLLLFVGQYLLQTAIAASRRMYDTRTFTRIYSDLAGRLVDAQRRCGVQVSQVAARSALSRELIDFLERDLGIALCTLYSVLGTAVVLSLHDYRLGLCCLLMVLPATAINVWHGKRSAALHGRLNDQFETEVEVIQLGGGDQVRSHYESLARHRVQLSDCQAYASAVLELCVLGMLTAALWWCCANAQTTAGDVYAVFRYALMFIMGLHNVPVLVQQAARLRDIGRRLQ